MLIELSFRVHMGKELMVYYPTVLDSIRSMDEILQDLKHAPTWSMEGTSTHVA